MPLIAVIFLSCTAEKQGIEKNKPVDFSQVKVTDDFWQPRLLTHATVTVPACIRQCETETRRIDNFAIAAGMQEGIFQGFSTTTPTCTRCWKDLLLTHEQSESGT
jgi:hypothetical protein